MQISSANKRIARNTIMLYVRMLLIMAVTLYSSRIVLRILGVEDYGIYNVVGGVITMLSFLTNSLGNAGSRFITYALGEGDPIKLKEVFSSVLYIHLILAFVVVILGETIGIWFVCNKLVIPPERLPAALWVYHCSIITAVLSIISAPYNAAIIAHERMSAFAYISVLESLLKLGAIIILIYISTDKLIAYAILLLIVQGCIRFLYGHYCANHFEETKTMHHWNAAQIKQIAAYAGWTVNGYLAIIGYTQGINILLNIFFGPVANAARGIAVQVQGAVMQFVSSFQTAVRPQIIKSYANLDLEHMHKLVVATSKYGFFLMLLLVFPILLCVEPILHIWLGAVPEYTNNFVRIMLLCALLEPLKSGLIAAIHATGDIKRFQIYEGTSLLSVVPIAYILLKTLHISPEIVMITYFFIEVVTQVIRIRIVIPKISMRFYDYFRNVLIPLIFPTACLIFPLIFIVVPNDISLLRLLEYLILGGAYILVCISIFGLNRQEKLIGLQLIKTKLKSILHI